MKTIFQQFLLISILIYFTRAKRSENAVPESFKIGQSLQKLTKHFLQVPMTERIPPVHIQRRIIGVKYKNGTENLNKSELWRPLVIYVVSGTKVMRYVAITYTVLSVLVTATLTIFTFLGMFKVATVVVVKNQFDEKKPARDLPVALAFSLRSKKYSQTPIETMAPENTKAASSKEVKPTKLIH